MARVGKIPLYPAGIERDYAVALLRNVSKIKSLWRNLVVPHIRQDADPADQIPIDNLAELERALLELERGVQALYSLQAVRALTTETAERAANFILRQTSRSLLSVGAPSDIGVNPLETNPDLRRLVESWATKNVTLVQSIGTQAQEAIKTTVLTGYANGASWRDIVKEVEKGLNGQSGRFRTVENRAKLIARNEISNLNSALTKYRLTDAGVKKYQWITAQDERVRASHRVLQGEIFSVSGEGTAPGGIFPGSEINCRCVALPIPPEKGDKNGDES